MGIRRPAFRLGTIKKAQVTAIKSPLSVKKDGINQGAASVLCLLSFRNGKLGGKTDVRENSTSRKNERGRGRRGQGSRGDHRRTRSLDRGVLDWGTAQKRERF